MMIHNVKVDRSCACIECIGDFLTKVGEVGGEDGGGEGGFFHGAILVNFVN